MLKTRYYKSHKEVRQDLELQDFAHDVSLGSGRVRFVPTVCAVCGSCYILNSNCCFILRFNSRTYTKIHTLTVVKGGEGVDGTPPWYILGVVVLRDACDVTNNGRHLGRYIGFYQELEIRLKSREMVFFCALLEK